jgi:DNA-binding transcriptional ArsR family regulator
MTGPRPLADPRAMRAVAHPVRLALLEQLNLHGPQTATELAARVGQSPANCSWHLRHLAEHGFVEPAEASGGRRRPWQVSSRGMSWGEGELTPEQHLAGEELSRLFLQRELERFLDFQHRSPQEEPDWREAGTASQSMLWLTPEELTEVNREIRELLLARLDRLDDPALRPPGARLCSLVAWGAPMAQDGAPR